MTGPEHYREAERLVAIGEHDEKPGEAELYLRDIARAQVHATLALAAATAMNDGDSGLGIKDYTAWRHVASVNPPADGEMQP